MNDKELEEYMQKIDPNFDSHIEKGTIEMSHEYYNLLEERMARLINENQQLKENIKELEFTVGLRQKRNLISRFDKEFDEEDKKKNPNRDYAGIIPDAEEVYKRYYELKEQLEDKYKSFPKSVKNLSREQLEKLYLNLLHIENEDFKKIRQRDEDITFCLKSIKQEMKMSTDGRTKQEMKTCYEILKKYKR